MKAIVYTGADGKKSIMRPIEAARLAKSITLTSGKVLTAQSPIRADHLKRGWQVDGKVEWAETEDQFIARMLALHVPKDATNVRIVDDNEIPKGRIERDAYLKALP